MDITPDKIYFDYNGQKLIILFNGSYLAIYSMESLYSNTYSAKLNYEFLTSLLPYGPILTITILGFVNENIS